MSSIGSLFQAFLPILMIPVALFSGAYLLFYFPGVCYRAIHNRLPGVKWGRRHRRELLQLAVDIDYQLGLHYMDAGLYARLTDMAGRMQTYGIACPPVKRNDRRLLLQWHDFLATLAAYAGTHDLKAARQLWLDNQPSSDA